MSIKLSDIIDNMHLDKDPLYLELDEVNKNVYESYIIMAELLNPNNAYPYKLKGKWLWMYDDIMGNTYFVRLNYMPTNSPYWELKTAYFENGKPKYDPPVPQTATAKDWDKRSDTVAKIYRDEVLPIFLNQNNADSLYIKPLDSKRYAFSERMVKKFTPSDKIEIEYHSPTKIILKKNLTNTENSFTL